MDPDDTPEDPILRQAAELIKSYAPLDQIRLLLTSGVDLDAPLNHGLRLVHYAVYHRHIEALTLLLVRGADASVMDEKGFSPVHMAAEIGFCNVIRTLLTYNARVDFSKVSLYGVDLDAPLNHGLRLVHYAVYHGHIEALTLLLVRGADASVMDEKGLSPVHMAAEIGFCNVIRTLLTYNARVDFSKVLPGDTPYSHPPRASPAYEPLHLALKGVCYRAAELLLKHGANPNARYPAGSEINFLDPLDDKAVEILLRHGADPNARNAQGITLLMKACRSPEGLGTAQLLIAYGADVSATTDEEQRTPLHCAVLSGNSDMVKLLVSNGAQVLLPPGYSKPPPFFFAMLRGDFDMMRYLLSLGADINQGSAVVGSTLHVALTELGQTKASVVKFLLENGADPNAILTSGFRTILKPPLGEYFATVPNPDLAIVRDMLKFGARIVLQGQRQHPLGILQTLHNIDPRSNAEVLELVAEAAESFCISLIDSSVLMTNRHKLVLLKRAMTPHSLMHCSRICLRDIIGWGPKLIAAVRELPVPEVLKDYLLFQE